MVQWGFVMCVTVFKKPKASEVGNTKDGVIKQVADAVCFFSSGSRRANRDAGGMSFLLNGQTGELTVSQVVTTNDNIWLCLARVVSRETRKRANNVNRQCFLQKHVDKAKLKVRFCSSLGAVLGTNDQHKECWGL
jgi:hypothetical protein